jgi:NAD(P)-dependent dehydrogenase (short-subunit alcohol dehydrogenase family)
MNLEGKACLITGASGGIGAALARALSERGARVALLARRIPELERLAAQLEGDGAGGGAVDRRAVAIEADVTDGKTIGSAVANAVQALGGLDLLVNNAGLGYYGPLEGMDSADLRALFETNVLGVLHVARAALPHLKRAGGLIVNISSGLSLRALPFLSAYAGTKAMLNLISDGLRMELRPYGIRVLTYGPPTTDTGFFRHSRGTPQPEKAMRRMKLARAEDVAERIVRAIERERRQVIERGILGFINLLAPRLLDAMFYRFMVAPQHATDQGKEDV